MKPYGIEVVTMHVQLDFPPEPCSLKDQTRALLAEQPAAGGELLNRGDWITRPLWERWGDQLADEGMTCEEFCHIATGYQNEMRLWVVGERTWEHAIGGLIGRVKRRVRSRPDIESEVVVMQRI
jgi:hypothetical protein